MDLVEIKDGKAVTTSILVANKFGKQHKNVLRVIDDILKNCNKINALNFEPVENIEVFKNKKEVRRHYELTEIGYSIVVMGFTGQQALDFKFEYANEFEKMRHAIESKQTEHYKTQSAWAMGELEEMQARQPNHKDSLACKLGIKAHQVGDYFKYLVGIGELEARTKQVTRTTYHPTKNSQHTYGAIGSTLLFSDSVKDVAPANVDWTEIQ